MKVIQAKGTIRAVGHHIGKMTREEIEFQMTHLLPEILEDGFDGDYLGMMRAAIEQHKRAAKFWPEGAAFLEGMARGAGIALKALLPIAYCEEIAVGPSAEAMSEKCSTLVIRTDEGWVIGHQEDYVPWFYGKLLIYDLQFDGCPRMVSLNYPGTYPGVAGSLNAAGVATTNNSLWPAPQHGIAKQVKHFRATLERDLSGALAWLVFPPCALTDHFTVLGGEEDLAMSVEVTNHPEAPEPVEMRMIAHDGMRDEGVVLAPFYHTNHVRWLEPWVSGKVKDPANRSSAMRARKLRDICRAGAPNTADGLAELLTKRDGILNRDEMRDLTGSATVTLATTLIEPSQGRIRFYRYSEGETKRDDFTL